MIALLAKADKYVIVNIDSCSGLSQDKGGIDYIAETGAMGLLSTRLQTVQRAKKSGLVTMQKIFVTDRSTWLRSLNALEQSEPDYVQLMPAPMLPLIPQADRQRLPPIVASGFVSHGRRHSQRARQRRDGGFQQRQRAVESPLLVNQRS